MSDPDDQPPFHFTPQVGIIAAIALLALAIPLAAIGLYFREDTNQKTSPNRADTSAVLAPMERTLETLADSRLAGDRLNFDENVVLSLEPKPDESIEQCTTRLIAAVQTVHGTALETDSQSEDASVVTWVVTIPKLKSKSFRRSLGIAANDNDATNSQLVEEGTEFIRVEISRPTVQP